MDSDKDIFCYVDSDGRERKGDPVELLRRLTTLLHGVPNEFFRRAEYPMEKPPPDGSPPDAKPQLHVPEGFDPETSIRANEQLARAVCKAFKLGEPWDDLKGAGVKERVWEKVLDDFMEFLQGEASGADGGPTLPASSAPKS